MPVVIPESVVVSIPSAISLHVVISAPFDMSMPFVYSRMPFDTTDRASFGLVSASILLPSGPDFWASSYKTSRYPVAGNPGTPGTQAYLGPAMSGSRYTGVGGSTLDQGYHGSGRLAHHPAA